MWWAIWEMDAFASTIKRCPTGIDWADNETRLPVADEKWFNREFQASCFLERKPNHRLAALQQSGNDSAKAWFLVLNSYMRDGHVTSHFRSPRPGDGRYGSSSDSRQYVAKDTADKLAILANCLTCFGMALPKALQYRNNEFLSFNSRDPSAVSTARQLHCAKFSIHVMTQLARLMIHHHDAYQGALQDLGLPGATGENRAVSESDATPALRGGPKRKGFQECMAASDELLQIVSRCSHDHVRYVNPFLASTIWYGAAVHLTWKVLAPPEENGELIFSKYEVMRMSFEESTAFWDLPKTLGVNLRTMEEKIKRFKSPRRFSTSYFLTGRPNPNYNKKPQDKGNRRSSTAQIPARDKEENFEQDSMAATMQEPSWENITRNVSDGQLMDGGTGEGGSIFPRSTDQFDFDLFVPVGLSTQSHDNFPAPRGLWDDFGLDMGCAADSTEVFQGLLQ
jgi:hypothetical protein